MRLSVFIGVIFLAFRASAADLPSFDIKALCSEATDGSIIDDEKECIDNEQTARDALRVRIESFAEERVRECTKSAAEGHNGSYLALLGCMVCRTNLKVHLLQRSLHPCNKGTLLGRPFRCPGQI